MTAVTRPRCGNDPRAQLTDGDRQALADFRAFLTRRAQEKTMTDQTPIAEALSAADEHSCQMQDGVGYQALAEAALAPLEAKARALREQLDAKHRAEVLREAADALLSADLGPRPGHTDDYRRGWDDATHRAASYLRARADEAQR